MKKVIVFAIVGISLSIGIVLFTDPYQKYVYTPPVTPTPVKLDAREIETMINEYRVLNGLSELPRDPLACEVAEKRLPMVRENYSHDGFVEVTNAVYAKVDSVVNFGENLVAERDAWDSLKAWKDSSLHNKAMLDSQWDGQCIAEDDVYVVSIFIDRG